MKKYCLLLLTLASCQNKDVNREIATAPVSREDKQKLGFGSILGPEGLTLSTDNVRGRTVDSDGVKVVNRYLWKASLDTLAFAPLVSSDGPGGVLVTDWYQANGAADRLKIQVRITSPELKATALEVTVYRQIKSSCNWVDGGTDKNASRNLENIILQRAREIRVQQQSQ